MKRKTSNGTKDTRFTLKWVTSPAALEATRRDPSGVYLADYHLVEYFGLEFLRQEVVTGCLAEAFCSVAPVERESWENETYR